MAKEKLSDVVITEIPINETMLREGVMSTLAVVSGKRRRYAYKYVLTNKGIWMRSKKFLFFKAKTSFIAYEDILHYKNTKYFASDTIMFYPKNSKRPTNHISFDDMNEVMQILGRFIKKADSK